MTLVGKIRVACPACGVEQECELVQSINTERTPALRKRLIAGELNQLACACGKRVQLAGNLLYHDPVASFLCHVVPGGDPAMAKAADAFHASGATGTLRLVPSQNALVEKIKIVDAGLEDWVIEIAKVLLLASLGITDLDRIVLFDRVEDDRLYWVMFDGATPTGFSSPRVAYDNIRRERAASRPAADELQIDRVWAVEALRKILARPN